MPYKDPTKRNLCSQRMYWKHRAKKLAWSRGHAKTTKRHLKRKDYMRRWREAHPEKQHEYNQRRMHWNAAKIKESKRLYYLKNKVRLLEKRRRYCQNNKAKVRASSDAWAKRNKYRIKQMRRASALRNIQNHRACSLAWWKRQKKTNPEHYHARHQSVKALRRRRMKLSTTDLNAVVVWMALVRRSAGIVCSYCPKKIYGSEIHFDHKIPLSRGGAHSIANLTPACQDCNRYKQSKTPEEFREYRQEIAEHSGTGVACG